MSLRALFPVLGMTLVASATLAASPALAQQKSLGKAFAKVDRDGNGVITKAEAKQAGMMQLARHWPKADKNGDTVLGQKEFRTYKAQAPATIGKGKFQHPETVIWDERADVYLVSNINGPLTATDDNGFISKVSPSGKIIALKWIDGKTPGVVLHGPKGMILRGDRLIVADVGGVRYFERATGKPTNSNTLSNAYMLNDVALGPKGKNVYVTDTGGSTAHHPGAVYRLGDSGSERIIAQGKYLDRPDGIIPHKNGLLITPFAAHAKEVYYLTPADGQRKTFATMPKPQLDGLLQLPDGSLVITSWQGSAVYRWHNGKVKTIAKELKTPAQIGYDHKRGRLLVPVLRENKVMAYSIGGKQSKSKRKSKRGTGSKSKPKPQGQ